MLNLSSPFTRGGTFLFAWHYFKAKKTTNAINVIAWISIVAIAIVFHYLKVQGGQQVFPILK